MGNILNFPKRPNIRLTIELNLTTSKALANRQKKENLTTSTLFNRAMQIYDHLISAQERGEIIIVGDKKFTIL